MYIVIAQKKATKLQLPVVCGSMHIHGGSSNAQAARMGIGVCVVCHVVGTSLVGH